MIYLYWLVQGVFLSGEGTAEKKNKLLTSDHLPTFSSPQWTHKCRPKCGWLVIPSNWLTLYSIRLWKQKESWEKKAPKTVGKPECVLFCILPNRDFELSSKFWFDLFFTPQYPVFPQWIPSQWWWWWWLFSHMLKKDYVEFWRKFKRWPNFETIFTINWAPSGGGGCDGRILPATLHSLSPITLPVRSLASSAVPLFRLFRSGGGERELSALRSQRVGRTGRNEQTPPGRFFFCSQTINSWR